jgi:DNA-binding NarL/FixJ family response regulator
MDTELTLLTIDDHEIVCLGIAHLLTDYFPKSTIFTASNISNALTIFDREKVDIVILDLSMPGINDLTGLVALRKRQPQTSIIVFSANEDADKILASIEAGAAGYVTKQQGNTQLIQAINKIFEGEVYIPKELIISNVNDIKEFSPPNTNHLITGLLSARQLEIMELIKIGDSNKEISRTLGITEGTVKIHLSNIFKILDVKNRTSAIMKIFERN